jgi:hypothetical protein
MTGYRDDREGLRQALEESRKEAAELKERLAELEAKAGGDDDEDETEPAPPSAPPSTKGPSRNAWLAGFGTLALFLLGPLLGIFVCVSISPKKPTGSIQSTGGELGKWNMSIDKCQSGDRTNFFGVDLYSHTNAKLGVRVLVDPSKGKLLNVKVPDGSDRAIQLEKKSCTKFDIDVKKTNTEVNSIRLYEGRIDFDCTYGDGKERVSGTVKFENCQ